MNIGNKIADIIPYVWNGKLKKGKIVFFKHGTTNVKEIKGIDLLKHK